MSDYIIGYEQFGDPDDVSEAHDWYITTPDGRKLTEFKQVIVELNRLHQLKDRRTYLTDIDGNITVEKN